jgi:hypothetical protein
MRGVIVDRMTDHAGGPQPAIRGGTMGQIQTRDPAVQMFLPWLAVRPGRQADLASMRGEVW